MDVRGGGVTLMFGAEGKIVIRLVKIDIWREIMCDQTSCCKSFSIRGKTTSTESLPSFNLMIIALCII